MIYNGTINNCGKICNSCAVYIMLLAMFFRISISISSVFYLFLLLLKKKVYWNNNSLNIKMGNLKEINMKYQKHYYFDDMINIKDFDENYSKKTKIQTKTLKFITLGIPQWKIVIIQKNNILNYLYLIIGKIDE